MRKTIIILLSIIFLVTGCKITKQVYTTTETHTNETVVENPLKRKCNRLEKNIDKFTGDITYRTNPNSSITFVKHLNKDRNSINYFIRAEAYGFTPTVQKEGFYILFKDGTKIEKNNAKIEVNVNTYGTSSYVYSTIVSLTWAELQQLATKEIEVYRLYIYDMEVSNKDTQKIMNDASCIGYVFPHPTTDIE